MHLSDDERQAHLARVQADINSKFQVAMAKTDRPDALQAVIDRLKATNFNDLYFNPRNIAKIPDILLTGETIQYATSGMDNKTERAALILVTDRRLILIDNRMFLQPKTVILDAEKIEHVTEIDGVVLGRVIIRTGLVHDYDLGSIYLPTVAPLIAALEQFIDTDDDGKHRSVKYKDSDA